MSYLDDPRVLFAAERTLLAWQRTAIALIGLGFVIERFGLFMRMLPGVASTLSPFHRSVSLVFGVLLLLLGATVAGLSAFQFRRFVRTLSDAEIPHGHLTWFGPAVNYGLAAIALVLTAWFLSTAG